MTPDSATSQTVAPLVGHHGQVSVERQPFLLTFVCTGNICRSPIAKVVVADLIAREGLADVVTVDSAGIGDWHVGEQADPRAIEVLANYGYDGSTHRARQIDPEEMNRTDLMIALDSSHLAYLHTSARTPADRDRARLLRWFDPDAPPDALDVADPYYGEGAEFDLVIRQVQAAAPGVVRAVSQCVSVV